MQRFLLHTCILDRLCAPLCAAVLDGEDPAPERISACQEVLELLERNNVFLIALDDERRWYRYHYLFASALRQMGDTAIAGVDVLHRRASAWYEQRDLLDQAIRHALAGSLYDGAADLIGRAARALAPRGETQTIATWLRALPAATLRARPQLAIMYAWLLVDMHDLRGAEQYLEYAEAALETPSHRGDERRPAEGAGDIRAVIGAARAVICVMRGDTDRAIPRAQAALAGLADTDLRARSIAGIALGLAHLSQGAASQAAEAFREVAVANRATHLGLFMVLAVVGEASAHRLAGALDLAIAAYERGIEWCGAGAHQFLLAGSLHTGLADILRERNELEAALERATYGIRRATELGAAQAERWIEWRACDLLILARIKQAQGDLAGALAVAREARDALRGHGASAFAAILGAFEAQIHLAQGDLDAAVRWLRSVEAPESRPRFGLTPQYFLYAIEHLEIAPAQVLIAQGRATGDPVPVRRALTLLDELRARAERSDMAWPRSKARALQALAYQAIGEMAATDP